ncbi:hypothetical protein FRUB_09511 [Fimbriiglobus ruber]|uniref:Uncharacterized protein n=1 Tax=Fimbriiglobus ruber TaxID=1908690 RepID=A0A225D167_9BACT|nr:hypothetical protein FRUB_09511 [Fimbriiglobus ruber]
MTLPSNSEFSSFFVWTIGYHNFVLVIMILQQATRYHGQRRGNVYVLYFQQS